MGAGAWVNSTAIGPGNDAPGVYFRVVMGVVGTGPRYHVVEGVMHADIAKEFGRYLLEAAERAPLDIEANREADR